MSRELSDTAVDIKALRRLYSDGGVVPPDLIGEIYCRIRCVPDLGAWTTIVSEDEALGQADALLRRDPLDLPLYGVPFSVKDNIHVAGLPTTAGCPAFSHVPERSATIVSRMQDAGAILIGKNTMDQFATGLVGIRSPVHPVNVFDRNRVPGGSSSGSAVAVAAGLVSIALGSDTGGSGRVPAALSNIVGFKPTPGVISTAGMIYANRSFDCVPTFALTCDDAATVFDVLVGEDTEDPFLLEDPGAQRSLLGVDGNLTVGIPTREFLEFDDDMGMACFDAAVSHFLQSGATIVKLDLSPFLEAGEMVFGGPILAERFASVGEFIATHRTEVHPVVAGIIESAGGFTAADLVRTQHRLRHLRAQTDRQMRNVQVLMVPTVSSIPTIAEAERDPVAVNARMGRYTYFGNPLGLCAVAVPAGFRPDGLPFGVCLYARGRADAALLRIAAQFQRATNSSFGAGRCFGATDELEAS
jgi:allophanate hydrolase